MRRLVLSTLTACSSGSGSLSPDEPSGQVAADSDTDGDTDGDTVGVAVEGAVAEAGTIEGENTFEFIYEDGRTSVFGGTAWGTAAEETVRLSLQTVVTDESGEPFITIEGRGELVR